MLHRMAFHLICLLVSLYLDNSTVKAYLYNQGYTVSLSSWLACHILNHSQKHGITLTLGYINTHLNVEADYLSWRRLVPEWHLLPHIAEVAFQLWGQQEIDHWHPHVPINVSIITPLKNPLPMEALGLSTLYLSWTFKVSYEFSPSICVLPSAVQVSGRTCHRSIQT